MRPTLPASTIVWCSIGSLSTIKPNIGQYKDDSGSENLVLYSLGVEGSAAPRLEQGALRVRRVDTRRHSLFQSSAPPMVRQIEGGRQMFRPGSHRTAIAPNSTGVLVGISVCLNVAACAMSLAALLVWSVLGGAVHSLTG